MIAYVLAVRALNHPNGSIVMSCYNSDRYGIDQLANDAAVSQAVRRDDLRITASGCRHDREGLTQRTRDPYVIDQQFKSLVDAHGHAWTAKKPSEGL
jgi:hypothetical protein